MKQNFSSKKTFLIAMIVSFSISALIGIFVFLFEYSEETEFRLLITTLVTGIYSLAGLFYYVLYEKRKFPLLVLSGMVISIIGFLETVAVIWGLIYLSDDIWKAPIIFIILTVSIAHSCLLLLIKPKKALVNTVVSATIVFISIVVLTLIILILNDFKDVGKSFYSRLLGVSAILDTLGTIVAPILNKVYSINH